MISHFRDKIKELQKQIDQIQSECSHPEVCLTKKYWRVDDGPRGLNYSESYKEEGYYNCHCSLCDKKWTEESK